MWKDSYLLFLVDGDRGRETRRKGAGGGRRGGGKIDSQGGGKREKGKHYAALCNILQSKKCKEAGANKYRAGTGIKGYGKREV